MRITEVRITPADDAHADDRVLAYASITLDGVLAIRGLRLIDGRRGAFVAMPDRKLADHCPNCGRKNAIRANYCGSCGDALGRPEDRAPVNDRGDLVYYDDIAFPTCDEARRYIERVVIAAYREEVAARRAAARAEMIADAVHAA